MARFSLGGDEDGEGEGSRSPRHKRPRMNFGLNSRRFNASTSASGSSSTTTIVQRPPPPPEPPQQLQTVEEEDERVSAEEDDSESENDVEEDDDEESPGNEDGDTGNSDESDEEEEAAEITVLPQSPPRIPRRPLVGRTVLDRSLAQYLARDNDRQVGSAPGSLASTATAAGVQDAPPSISPPAATDASVVFTLTESDVLDCFICCEPLTVPVYQCENGHIACSSCCTKSKNKCPTCSWPIGYNRCRAIENVLEAIRVSCQNIKHGCKESMTYNKKNEHEKACMFSPCSCPQSGCNFVSPSKQLYQHFSSNHANSATRFQYNFVFSITLFHKDKSHTLQEQNDGTLFILDNKEEILGNIVSISCIQPSFMGGFYYDLLARTKNGKGSSLRLESFAKSLPSQVSNPSSTDHLIIPCGFFENGGSLKMELRIWHKGQAPPNLGLADPPHTKPYFTRRILKLPISL